MTDCADAGRLMGHQLFKSGNAGSGSTTVFTTDKGSRPILATMFQAIRICNMTLQNIHLLEADQVTIDDYTAQAHYVRAFAHFELFRFWGVNAISYQSIGSRRPMGYSTFIKT